MKKQTAILLLCVCALLTSCGETDSSQGKVTTAGQTSAVTEQASETQTEQPEETTAGQATESETETETETETTTTTAKATTTSKKTKKSTTTQASTTTQETTTTQEVTTTTATAPPVTTTTTTAAVTTTAATTTAKATTTASAMTTAKATTTTAAAEQTTKAPKKTTAAVTEAPKETTTTTTATKKKENPPAAVKAPGTVDFRVSTTSTKTKLSWKAVEGADGYVVWIKRSKDGKWERRKETTNTSCQLKEPRNKNYSFCVKAYRLDANGKKVYSEKAHASAFPYLYKENGVTYVDGILIVNKTYSLPSDYGNGLTQTTLDAFYEMQRGAANDGISLWITSGFRSYAVQSSLYWSYVNRDGSQWSADQYSARPGHSEHQSGLAFDLNYAGTAFNGTREAQWIAGNCYKYGFIIRYPYGKESKTGYNYESWHCRYVGKELAKILTESGLTLEEYYGLSSRYS